MFRRAFGRDPNAAELARWTEIANDFARMHEGESNPPDAPMKSLDVWKDVAHTMFNAKEFIYVR